MTSASDRYINRKRTEQAAKVACLIGPLLDCWYSLPNDEMSALEAEQPDLCAHMKAIGQIMDRED
jgi:hypothetical protein